MLKYLPSQYREIVRNKIISAAIGITFITVIAKILGYAEKILLAYYFGTGYQVDVYITVFTFITSIFIFVRELIEPGFLRVFTKAIQEDSKSAWGLFNSFFIFIVLITVGFSVFTFLYPENVCAVISPGFKGEKLQLTIEMIKISIPATIFYALSALTNITLNSFKKFIFPAIGDLILKVGLVLGLFLFYKSYGIYATSIGIFIGCLGRLTVHLLDLFKQIKYDTILINKSYYLETWQLTWPLLIGVIFSQISSIVDNVLASYLQDGAISSLSYAKKVIEFPIISIPYVLSVIIFPYFTSYHIEGDHAKATNYLNNTIKLILIIFIPLTAFFILNSVPIIELIYQRGAFKKESTLLTSKAFKIYAMGMFFMALETITVIYYYAKGNTKTPIFIGIACVILNLLIAYSLIPRFNYLAIAMGLVVSKGIKNCYLLYDLHKKGDFTIGFYFIFYILSATSVTSILSYLIISIMKDQSILVILSSSASIFAMVYFCFIFKMKDKLM